MPLAVKSAFLKMSCSLLPFLLQQPHQQDLYGPCSAAIQDPVRRRKDILGRDGIWIQRVFFFFAVTLLLTKIRKDVRLFRAQSWSLQTDIFVVSFSDQTLFFFFSGWSQLHFLSAEALCDFIILILHYNCLCAICDVGKAGTTFSNISLGNLPLY